MPIRLSGLLSRKSPSKLNLEPEENKNVLNKSDIFKFQAFGTKDRLKLQQVVLNLFHMYYVTRTGEGTQIIRVVF